MKLYQHLNRYIAKFTNPKPTIRKSVRTGKVYLLQQDNAVGRKRNRRKAAERRADRVEHLGPNLIKAMEWRYMRNKLRKVTGTEAEKLIKQKKIADDWAERRA